MESNLVTPDVNNFSGVVSEIRRLQIACSIARAAVRSADLDALRAKDEDESCQAALATGQARADLAAADAAMVSAHEALRTASKKEYGRRLAELQAREGAFRSGAKTIKAKIVELEAAGPEGLAHVALHSIEFERMASHD